jgi:1,2-diacylglycerol 3-beta-galactosyltransferase
MTSVDLIYFNAGGGHRAAAKALKEAMQSRPWQVRLVNLVEILDPAGQFYDKLGFQPEDLYNKRLANGLTLGMSQELKLLQWFIRLGHQAMVKKMQIHWLATRPDMVVSLIPNFDRALCQSLSLSLPGTPYVTVLTDMADCPPNFWIEPDQPQHVICGTDHAVAQALSAGCSAGHVHQTSGMIISPHFYAPRTVDRSVERRNHGLNDQQAVGVVMFGGYGSAAMKRIANRLPDTPLILICGKNAALAQSLRRSPATAARVVVEFTDDIAYWMRLADFFIGKPGPASLSEAVHMGLPVIVTRNAWTMPQERWNTQWVSDQGLGVVVRSFTKVQAAVDEIVGQLPQWQANVRKIQNRAVFEVPEILAKLLG